MKCAHCGKKIGVLRKLQDAEFCSEAHRRAYLKKQEDLALEFLLQSKPDFRPQPAPGVIIPPAAKREPVPALAERVAVAIRPAVLPASPVRISQPLGVPWCAILPGGIPAQAPRLCISRFAGTACAPMTPLAQAGRTALRPIPFERPRPNLPVATMRPFWIESAPQAPAKRPQAGFVPFRPGWMHVKPRPSTAPAAARFTTAPVFAGTGFAPARSAFRLACPTRPGIEINRGPASTIEPDSCTRLLTPPRAMAPPACGPLRHRVGTWQGASLALHKPCSSIALSLGGIRDCHLIKARPPAALAPPRNRISAACRSLVEQKPALGCSLNFVLRARSFEPAPPAAAKPRPPMSAGALAATPAAALIWKFKIHPVPAAKVSSPLPHPDTAPEPQIGERLVHFWRATPAWIRRLAVAGSAAVMIWPGLGWLSRSAPARNANQAIESRIRQRAAIQIQDDFRSGLSQWTGAPNWAASWSYDGTGFAGPGHLALLSNSLPLTDYRLEFLAQIDKKALGWVFRAADAGNYYATKLVESRRGGPAVFFILRYAVIDGQEQRRVQLPLPITGSAKSMFRVREEIRGSQFTTYLDGRVIDTWSDSSLTRGGVGFFADSGEAAYIRWVEVAQQDDFLGRLCSYIASLDQK